MRSEGLPVFFATEFCSAKQMNTSILSVSPGKAPGKAAVALMRSYAYLQACRWGQALKDARVAAVYSRQMPGGSEGWPRAFAAISSAIEGKQVHSRSACLQGFT